MPNVATHVCRPAVSWNLGLTSANRRCPTFLKEPGSWTGHCSRVARRGVPVLAAFTLVNGQGQATTYSKPECTLGTAPSCDVRLSGSRVAEQHAVIVQKGKQATIKALVGGDVMSGAMNGVDDDSRSWVNGQLLRPGVRYALASGDRLAFGTEDQAFSIEFEQGGGMNPLLEMAIKGMLAGSSPEVKKALQDTNGSGLCCAPDGTSTPSRGWDDAATPVEHIS
ncbi:hypothetical protein Agub_g13639 [Astrephomene gubernaculifera]|uniref:FHA domain-containing protein n=1 Tax=Astrephomene gubernaculifera TaxID=47775 RepID=A0AAD3E055_9CHLO|nr:hypothetical protein Agub_g13639 [Astrephomene gubernaculifera]